MSRALPLLVAILTGAASAAPAAAWDLSPEVSTQSRYVWRGMVLNDSPVLQPSLTVTQGGLAASVWANVDLTDDCGHRLENTEIDYWAAYTLKTPGVDLTVTAYEYTFPHTAVASTTEVWASAEWKTTFRPTLTVARDIDVVDGTYVMLTGSAPLGVLRTAGSDGLSLALNVGWGDRDYTRGYFPTSDAAHAVDYGARLDWSVAVGAATLGLDLQYTSFTSSKVKVPGFEGVRSNLLGGVAFTLPIKL